MFHWFSGLVANGKYWYRNALSLGHLSLSCKFRLTAGFGVRGGSFPVRWRCKRIGALRNRADL